jgi:hypothetical protein
MSVAKRGNVSCRRTGQKESRIFLEQHNEQKLSYYEMSVIDKKSEIWTLVFSLLDFDEILTVSEVCKEWYAIANSDKIWARFCRQPLCPKLQPEISIKNIGKIGNISDSFGFHDEASSSSQGVPLSASNRNSNTGIYKNQFIQQYLQDVKNPKWLMYRLKEMKDKLRRTEQQMQQQIQQLSYELSKQKLNADQMEKKMMVFLLVQNRYVKLKEKYKLQEKKLQQIESICEFRGQQIKDLRALLMEKDKALQQLRAQMNSSSVSEVNDASVSLSSSPRSLAYVSSTPINIPSSVKKERRFSAPKPKSHPLRRSHDPKEDTLEREQERDNDKEAKRKRNVGSKNNSGNSVASPTSSPRAAPISTSFERDFKHFMVTSNSKNVSSSPPSQRLSQLLASHILDDEEMDANFLEAVITAEEEFRHHRAIQKNEEKEMLVDKDEKKKFADVRSPKRSPNNSKSHIDKMSSKRSVKESSASPTNERDDASSNKKVSFSTKEPVIINNNQNDVHSNSIKRETKVTYKEDEEVSVQQTSSLSTGSRSPVLPRPMRVTKEKRANDWELNFNDLLFEEKIGTGASATVYKGTYKSQDVAIKILRMTEVTSEKDIKDFEKELEIIKTVRANNIVHFIGATLEPKFCIVLEYCPRGSVHSFLKNMNNDLPWELFLKWSIQTCQGILVLHDWQPSPIVHRDLKTPNLLIDKDWNIKLCDFGLSRFVTGNEKDAGTLAKFRGTYCYMATEIYFKDQYSVRSDVYSLGIVLWEMLHKCMTGKYEKPYSEYKFIRYDIQIPVQAATKGLRPTIPPCTPPIIAELVKSCWQSDPQLRPTCTQILQTLEEAKKEYEANPEKWNAVRTIPKKPIWT